MHLVEGGFIMTISINGTNGITYPDSTVQSTSTLPSAPAVGTIIFAKMIASGSSGVTIEHGENRSGTLLWYSDDASSNGPNVGVGTWRCLGYSTNLDRATAWLRVS